MWYRYFITVPRGTAESAPVRKEIGIPEGVITKVRVRFPPGSRGRVYTAVFQGTHKMWPRGFMPDPDPPLPPLVAPVPPPLETRAAWAWGDDEDIEMSEHVKNITGWHYTVEGFAPLTSYDHTVWWDFNVIESEYAEPLTILERLIKVLENLIGV